MSGKTGTLKALFQPRSIALVGATAREGAMFARPLTNLMRYGFQGALYPVNPKYDEILGHPCYPTLDAVPGPVDLVLAMVGAEQTLGVIAQSAAVQASVVMSFASGFAEMNEAGRALQDAAVKLARDHGIRIVGPNCLGAIYRPTGMTATFTPAVDSELPPPSGVAYVGQSGALGGAVLSFARDGGLGLTAWLSTGNQADVDLVEAGNYLMQDPQIRVLAMYTESLPDGEGFRTLLRNAAGLGKHVVVLRAGRSVAGRRSAASHTGAMVPEGSVFEVVAEAEGAHVVNDIDELVRISHVLTASRPASGPRLGIVSTSGGLAGLAADQAAAHGLAVDQLTPLTQSGLSCYIPEFGAVDNPIDLTAQLFNRGQDLEERLVNGEDMLEQVCELTLADENVDVLAVLLTSVFGRQADMVADVVLGVRERSAKPVLVAWLGGTEGTESGRARYRTGGLPVFGSVRDLAAAAAALQPRTVTASASPDRGEGPKPIQSLIRQLVLRAGRSILVESDCAPVLDGLGVPRPWSRLVNSRKDAEQVGEQKSGPFALKLQSPAVLHKTEAKAIRYPVSRDELGPTYDAIMAGPGATLGTNAVLGILIQAAASSGVELLVGVTSGEGGFPPMLTVGMGGISAELYADVVSRPLPLGRDQLRKMVMGLTGWPLLDGYLGAAPADVEALLAALDAFGTMAWTLRDLLDEAEINPLLVHPRGAGVSAVDCLIRLRTTANEDEEAE